MRGGERSAGLQERGKQHPAAAHEALAHFRHLAGQIGSSRCSSDQASVNVEVAKLGVEFLPFADVRLSPHNEIRAGKKAREPGHAKRIESDAKLGSARIVLVACRTWLFKTNRKVKSRGRLKFVKPVFQGKPGSFEKDMTAG